MGSFINSGALKMTDQELQVLCDSKAKEVLESTSNLPPAIRMIILTGVLGAAAYAANIKRQNVINALNSVFDDIEAGEIPGEI